MAIFKTRKDVNKELETVHKDLADRKAKMTAAILKGDDNTAEKLAGEIARLEARAGALRNALPLAAEKDEQAAEAARLADIENVKNRLQELEAKSGNLMKKQYEIVDDADAILAEYQDIMAIARRVGLHYAGSEEVGPAIMIGRAGREIKIRYGTGRPDFLLRYGLKPFRG